MNDDYGIAWMIAGGLRGQTREDMRMRTRRIALEEHARSRPSITHRLRRHISAALDGRTWGRRDPVAVTHNADCCPA